MDKSLELELLKAEILSSNICGELARSATNLVIGHGDLDAEVMLIGEAPGKSEDQTGLPFVGASGKFLNTMLEAAEISRQDIYITNIVKYRPPDNRDPKPEEIAAFWPYLLRQIEIIQPKRVFTLGKFSMKCFLPDAEIADMHGETVTYSENGVKFSLTPLYHPALALYNGKMRPILINDFVKAIRGEYTDW